MLRFCRAIKYRSVACQRGASSGNRKLVPQFRKSAGLVIKRLRVQIPAGAAEEFFTPELTLIRCPVNPPPPPAPLPPVLPQWHVKDPGHSANIAGGRLHLNAHIPLTQRSRSGLIMPQSGHSVGAYPETSSHSTCQGTFGQSRLSPLSHCGPILA